MTHTDRAFIAALQQSNARGVASAVAPQPRVSRPAVKSMAAKAPLSQHLAQRRVGDRLGRRTAPCPVVELDSFHWPVVVEQLAHAGRRELIALLTSLAEQAEPSPPVVAIVGARPGVGASTLALALARVGGGLGAATAIIDLCDRSGAASLLGMHRSTSVPLADSAVASREDHTLAYAAGGVVDPSELADLLSDLATDRELVLIDAGAPEQASRLLTAAADRVALQTVVIEATPADAEAVRLACRGLAPLGVAGVVETFAPLA